MENIAALWDPHAVSHTCSGSLSICPTTNKRRRLQWKLNNVNK
jgi:hypothetical protein